jgi:hypothetical protein
MKNYKFLLKPLLFIINIVFASYLVLEIENLKPSDFDKYTSLFGNEIKAREFHKNGKDYLKNIFIKYRAGNIDSLSFDKELESFLKSYYGVASMRSNE